MGIFIACNIYGAFCKILKNTENACKILKNRNIYTERQENSLEPALT
jgi:hypothetical protein